MLVATRFSTRVSEATESGNLPQLRILNSFMFNSFSYCKANVSRSGKMRPDADPRQLLRPYPEQPLPGRATDVPCLSSLVLIARVFLQRLSLRGPFSVHFRRRRPATSTQQLSPALAPSPQSISTVTPTATLFFLTTSGTQAIAPRDGWRLGTDILFQKASIAATQITSDLKAFEVGEGAWCVHGLVQQVASEGFTRCQPQVTLVMVNPAKS